MLTIPSILAILVFMTTYSLDEAQRVVEGYIKWDGCSDITFYPDQGGNVHFCGEKSAKVIGELLRVTYQIAEGFLGDKVDKDCFYDL
jgi:hypothetical protein